MTGTLPADVLHGDDPDLVDPHPEHSVALGAARLTAVAMSPTVVLPADSRRPPGPVGEPEAPTVQPPQPLPRPFVDPEPTRFVDRPPDRPSEPPAVLAAWCCGAARPATSAWSRASRRVAPAGDGSYADLGEVTVGLPATVRVGVAVLNRAQLGADPTEVHARFERVGVSC